MTVSRSRWTRLSIALAVVLAQVLLLARPTVAADEPQVVINQVLTDNFPDVTLVVTAVDSGGVPIPNVGKDQLQVVHNGQPIPDFDVSQVNAEQEGLAAVLVIDTSGSMKGQPLDDARAAATVFLDRMGPHDRLALVAFSDTVQVVQDLTDDREALTRALNGLFANGDTALYDAVVQASSMIADQPLGRRAVVVITDGEDTKSGHSLDDAIATARDASTPISVVGLGDVKPDPLRAMSGSTGGTYGEAPDSSQLSEKIGHVSDLLRTQYLIRYQAPDSRQPDNEIQVAINRDGHESRAAQRFEAPPMPPLGVSVADLAPGATVRGLVALRPTFVNARRVDQVEYAVDGTPIQTATQEPFDASWDTAKLPPGEHTLTVHARLGDREAQQDLKLTVGPAIQVAIKGLPAAGQDVSGKVKLSADLDSAAAATGVDWAVDGQPIGSAQQPPYEVEWDASSLAAGDHTVTADARDERGNVARASQAVRVVPIVPAAPTVAATAAPTAPATVAATAGATAAPTRAAATATPAGDGPLAALTGDNWWIAPALVLAALALVGLMLVMRSRRRAVVATEPISGRPHREPARMLPGPQDPPDHRELPTSVSPARSAAFTVPTDDATWRDAPGLGHQPGDGHETRPGEHTGPGHQHDPFDDGAEFHNQPTVILSELGTQAVDFSEHATRSTPTNFPTAPHPPDQPSRSTLTITLPGQGAQSWPLGMEQVIGRIPAPGVIVVSDTQVSRRHARISWEDGGYVYRDLAPTNPTLRGGQPIPNPCYLVDGDRLTVGRAELLFRA